MYDNMKPQDKKMEENILAIIGDNGRFMYGAHVASELEKRVPGFKATMHNPMSSSTIKRLVKSGILYQQKVGNRLYAGFANWMTNGVIDPQHMYDPSINVKRRKKRRNRKEASPKKSRSGPTVYKVADPNSAFEGLAKFPVDRDQIESWLIKCTGEIDVYIGKDGALYPRLKVVN